MLMFFICLKDVKALRFKQWSKAINVNNYLLRNFQINHGEKCQNLEKTQIKFVVLFK